MKHTEFIVIVSLLGFSASLLHGSPNCFSETTRTYSGITKLHGAKKALCTCHCTGQRTPDGTCLECEHKQVQIKSKPFDHMVSRSWSKPHKKVALWLRKIKATLLPSSSSS